MPTFCIIKIIIKTIQFLVSDSLLALLQAVLLSYKNISSSILSIYSSLLRVAALLLINFSACREMHAITIAIRLSVRPPSVTLVIDACTLQYLKIHCALHDRVVFLVLRPNFAVHGSGVYPKRWS